MAWRALEFDLESMAHTTIPAPHFWPELPKPVVTPRAPADLSDPFPCDIHTFPSNRQCRPLCLRERPFVRSEQGRRLVTWGGSKGLRWEGLLRGSNSAIRSL